MTSYHVRQAIVTKYIGPSNFRGSRIKARAAAGSVTVPYAHELNIEQNHAKAAQALALKYKWPGFWVQGGMPDDTGYCFVNDRAGKKDSVTWAFYVSELVTAGIES